MNKIYETNQMTLTLEDNMELMSRYEDNHFDLAIVDPEYCIGASKPSKKPSFIKQKNGSSLNVKVSDYAHKSWDEKLSSDLYFDELVRVSKEQIVWGCNYQDRHLKGGRLIWDKLTAGVDQFDGEIASLSFTNRVDIVYGMWSGMMQGLVFTRESIKAIRQQGNKKLNEKRIHPTQKPIALYKWILKKYSSVNDKILDTHLGSMSIACAVHEMNQVEGMKLHLTGCELDEDYFNDGVKRVKNAVSKISLFAQN